MNNTPWRVIAAGASELPDSVLDVLQTQQEQRTFGYLASAPASAPLPELGAAASQELAVGVIGGALVQHAPGLVMLDVDSTLTTTEAIDLLAARAGAGDQVAQITERAMRGELDFEASLRERVATLAGLPETVLAEVAPEMTLSPGATELLNALQQRGIRVGVTSGGFAQLVEPLASRLGLDFWNANHLEVVDGRLSGRVVGDVVDAARKARDLAEFAARYDVPMELTVAVGDGANDLEMLAAAGLGIAYCAKPLTAARADVSIPFPRLDAVLGFLALD